MAPVPGTRRFDPFSMFSGRGWNIAMVVILTPLLVGASWKLGLAVAASHVGGGLGWGLAVVALAHSIFVSVRRLRGRPEPGAPGKG